MSNPGKLISVELSPGNGVASGSFGNTLFVIVSGISTFGSFKISSKASIPGNSCTDCVSWLYVCTYELVAGCPTSGCTCLTACVCCSG